MIEKLMDLVFPENIYCMCCGAIIDKTRPYALCNSCMEHFHWQTGRTCVRCGKRLQDTYAGSTCYSCLEDSHHFDRAFSCVTYGLYERALMMDFKYENNPYMGRKIAEIMRDRMECEDISYDEVVPVPIHEERKQKRGYNQAEIIAKEFAKITGTKYNDSVRRTKDTRPMKDLSREDRFMNVDGAFEITKDVKGKNILLIDDIYTTGATLDAVSKALKEAGAQMVYGLCFASGINRRPDEDE